MGFRSVITDNIHKQADVHVVIGPHYAKNAWLYHPRVILIDRCYYRGDPEHVSVGWMREDGGRVFKIGEGKKLPVIRKHIRNDETIFLADYNGIIENADTIRHHPAVVVPKDSLVEALRKHGTAIGYNTTALVTAALEGLRVICKSSASIMSEKNWLELLPYADWHWSEIQNGDAWKHLQL